MRGPDCKAWQPYEVLRLRLYRAKGLTIKQCATRLERSDESVRSKWNYLNNPKRHYKPRAAETHSNIETIAIPKAKVVELYELGWRFDGFSHDGLCIMSKMHSEARSAIVISDANNSCTQESNSIMRDLEIA